MTETQRLVRSWFFVQLGMKDPGKTTKTDKNMLQGTIEPNQVDSIIEEGRALIQGGDAKQAVSCFVRAAS